VEINVASMAAVRTQTVNLDVVVQVSSLVIQYHVVKNAVTRLDVILLECLIVL